MFLWDNVRDTYQIQLIILVKHYNMILYALYDDKTLESPCMNAYLSCCLNVGLVVVLLFVI